MELPAPGAEWIVHLTGLGLCQVSKVEGRVGPGSSGSGQGQAVRGILESELGKRM